MAERINFTHNPDLSKTLSQAIENGDVELLENLIKSGADINAVDKYGETVLVSNVKTENEKMVEKLMQCGADVNAANEYGKTALFYAVEKGNEKIVEKLKECGADINATDEDGETALFYAVENDNEKMVGILIKCGANINATDKDGETALFCAVKKENENIVKQLIECGADIKASDKDGETALFCAVENKEIRVIEKLLEFGADINATDEDGETALFYAVENDNKKMIDTLIEHGADVNATNKHGKTAFPSDVQNSNDVRKCNEVGANVVQIEQTAKKIKTWKKPVSKNHERYLQKVARHLESKYIEQYWYHQDHFASGSFGAVYVGINEKDGREVAIKRIEKRHMQRPEDKREITNLTALADCEQVVRYINFFEDDNFSYIVLELMEGNLEQFLNKTIGMNTKFSLCQDIVKGLKFLHDQSILHRDLKPKNILYKMYPKLCLKIADFGLSRRMDSTGSSTSVYGSNVGTRSWIAPEVLKSEKAPSKSSDVFACGLVLHYILSVRKHPFAPRVGGLQHETEANILNGNMEGWDDSLCPEAAHLLKEMRDGNESRRPSADKALDHPFFWSNKKKTDLLTAVGNQPEFECPRAKKTLPLTAVETDLEARFGTIVKYVDWNDQGYAHMPAIYTEMTKKRKRYDTRSVVELVRFIRNAYAHVSDITKSAPIKRQLLEDFVFLEYFPNLVMEVYKAVITHGWHQTREEIKYALSECL